MSGRGKRGRSAAVSVRARVSAHDGGPVAERCGQKRDEGSGATRLARRIAAIRLRGRIGVTERSGRFGPNGPNGRIGQWGCTPGRHAYRQPTLAVIADSATLLEVLGPAQASYGDGGLVP